MQDLLVRLKLLLESLLLLVVVLYLLQAKELLLKKLDKLLCLVYS